MRTLRAFLSVNCIEFNQNYQLSKEGSHHLSQVLRAKVGNEVEVFDGKGNTFLSKIVQIDNVVTVNILKALEHDRHESPLAIHLLVAVGKGEKMDWIIQKATELGVRAIYPIITKRCEVHLSAERWHKKIERWQEIAFNACEQSQRSIVPQIHEISSLSSRLQDAQIGLKLLLHPGEEGKSFQELLHQTDSLAQHPVNLISLLIGPEGGFDKNEVQSAKEKAYLSIACGPRILRMETAVMASVAILQMMFGDM